MCGADVSTTFSVSLSFCAALPASFLDCTEDFAVAVTDGGAVEDGKVEAAVAPFCDT